MAWYTLQYISGKTKEKMTKNNMENREGNKWDEFGRETLQQQARMAIRDRTMAQKQRT